MRLQERNRENREPESLIALINIVFLILIFFLVASTIRPFTDREVNLARISKHAGSERAQRIVIVRRDGSIHQAGRSVSKDELGAEFANWSKEPERAITVVADKDTPATVLVGVATLATAAGIKSVNLLARKGQQ